MLLLPTGAPAVCFHGALCALQAALLMLLAAAAASICSHRPLQHLEHCWVMQYRRACALTGCSFVKVMCITSSSAAEFNSQQQQQQHEQQHSDRSA